ncbi:MAG: polysaccharide deacetylase family protein [Pseudomonadota bacterium]
MIYKPCLYLVFTLFILSYAFSANAKEVALTIDDLPFVGNAHQNPGKLRRENKRFRMILEILKKENVPATGFVVANSIEKGQWQLLEEFQRSGNLIGNHSYSHPNFNRISATAAIDNIKRADEILVPLLSKPKYFRYPFLATGKNCEEYTKIKDYLVTNNYIVAPVTIDSKDFRFNYQFLNIPWRKRKAYLNSFRRRYIGFIMSQTTRAERKAMKQVNRPIKQILLIHMNTLNAYALQDIIKSFRKRGYRFITLEEALTDPYYKEKNGLLLQTQHRCDTTTELTDASKSE